MMRRSGRAGTRILATAAALVVLLSGATSTRAQEPDAAPSGAGTVAGVRLYGPLAELPAGHWAYRSLEELMRAGLVVEYAPGAFDAERTISRYEAALLLVDAFRRAGAVTASPEGPARLRTLLPERLVASAASGAGDRGELLEIVKGLGREFAEELKVLGFAMEGVQPGDARPAGAGGSIELRSSASVSLQTGGVKSAAGSGSAVAPSGGETARPAAGPAQTGGAGAVAGPTGSAGPESAGKGGLLVETQPTEEAPARGVAVPGPAVSVTSSYELGLRVAVPGRWDVDGQVNLGTLEPTQLGLLVLSPSTDRWVWARVGSVDSSVAGGLALGDGAEALTLQGLEARVLGGDSRTGIVIASEVLPGGASAASDPGKGRALAVLDGSLALSREIVVGGAIIRGGAGPEELWQLDRGATVTALAGRYSPVPWLSITGEYAQNLWALPLVASAMRLGATLHLGDVKLGARVGRVAPEFQPALGSAAPGDEVGLDATVRLGDVQLRAGAGRRNVTDGTGEPSPELITSVGLRIGLIAGASVTADYELISVQDLEEGRRPERSRTRLGLNWDASAARVQMGLEWAAGHQEPGSARADPGRLEASAAVSYQLSPYAAVMLGYHLIDFGADRERADATARITLRF